MNIFEVVGPVMVGPSSSHTAGAVRIGNVCRKLVGEPVVDADILLHGSFLATGRGHGTDRALVAGLLGLDVADPRIPESFALAEKAGMTFEGILRQSDKNNQGICDLAVYALLAQDYHS